MGPLGVHDEVRRERFKMEKLKKKGSWIQESWIGFGYFFEKKTKKIAGRDKDLIQTRWPREAVAFSDR